MENIPGIIMLLLIVAGLILSIAALLMPLFVVAISSRVKDIDMTLKKMEHMMRHGK